MTAIPLRQALANFSDEIEVASDICVNLEEIFSDRLMDGGSDSTFVRVELQNIDRLMQMLADFQRFASYLSLSAPESVISGADCEDKIVMEDLHRRLFAPSATRTGQNSAGGDITFF